MPTSELYLKENIELIIHYFGECVSSPVSQIIMNFAREPECGDGDRIRIFTGCKQKISCIPVTIRIGNLKINKWFCENCSKNFTRILKD